jgi:hypothetical protein
MKRICLFVLVTIMGIVPSFAQEDQVQHFAVTIFL